MVNLAPYESILSFTPNPPQHLVCARHAACPNRSYTAMLHYLYFTHLIGLAALLPSPYAILVYQLRLHRVKPASKAHDHGVIGIPQEVSYQLPIYYGLLVQTSSVRLAPVRVSGHQLSVTIACRGLLTGPLFPIGIENLIYIILFCYGSSNGY